MPQRLLNIQVVAVGAQDRILMVSGRLRPTNAEQRDDQKTDNSYETSKASQFVSPPVGHRAADTSA